MQEQRLQNLPQSDMTGAEIISLYQQSAPVDVEGIARKLGLLVRRETMPGDISGMIKRPGPFGGGYRVSVNANHAPTRQRFTLAHEIAHFVLHRSLIGDGIVDDALYRSSKGDDIEWQANSYAATILMPARLVREHFRNGTRSFVDMARLFDVSPEVARIRMKELRLG